MPSRTTSESATYVALLRGINVGGKHMLPMKQLAEMFGDAKCSNVRTYIQSGNVIFSAPAALVGRIPQLISIRVAHSFGFQAPVIVRSVDDLERILRSNPFLKAGEPESTAHVYFLTDVPSPGAIKSLDPDRSAGDAFRVVGREIYLHLPNGAGRTKLSSAYFDTKLGTVGTQRNWATVLKLREMMKD